MTPPTPRSRIIASSELVILVPWNATLMSWPTLRSTDIPLTTSPVGLGVVVVGAQAAIALAAAARRKSRRLMRAGLADVLPPAAYRPAPPRGPRARRARRHTKGALMRAARVPRRMDCAPHRARRRSRAAPSRAP